VATRHPLAAALKALFEEERARWTALQDDLRDGLAVQEDIGAAWLYGSVARGEDEPGSDVDIVLVLNEGTLDAAQRVRDELQALGDRLNLHFSTVVLTPAELALLRQDDPWWSNVTRDAKVLKGGSPGQEAARHARPAEAA
jgi:predicted nucleotidyltransferase